MVRIYVAAGLVFALFVSLVIQALWDPPAASWVALAAACALAVGRAVGVITFGDLADELRKRLTLPPARDEHEVER